MYTTDYEAIERLPDGPKKNVITYLTEKLGWYAIFEGKSSWTLIEPDSGGVFIHHKNYRKVNDFLCNTLLKPIAWHINGFDYVGARMDAMQKDILFGIDVKLTKS